MRQKLCFVVLYCLFITYSSVICITISYSDPSRCNNDQYFQISSLECKSCELNMNRSLSGLACTCKSGYYFVQNKGGDNNVKCSKCGSNEVTAEDKWSCVKCPVDTSFDPSTSTCKKKCNSTAISMDKQIDGQAFANRRRRCITCLNDTQPDSKQFTCKRCDQSVIAITASLTSGVSCTCPESTQTTSRGGVCFQKTVLDSFNIPDASSVSSTYTVTFQQKSVVSAFFIENLQATSVLCCLYRNFTACQVLGNLCVMINYNKDNFENSATSKTDACNEYLKIVKCKSSMCSCGSFVKGLGDWPYFMPWLFYTSETADKTLTKTDISIKYQKSQKIRFAVAIYTPNGSFVAVQNDTNIFQLCPEKESKSKNAFSFLTTYSISCSIPVQRLKEMPTLFYDLYFFVGNDLRDVPILVENYKAKGVLVNNNIDKSTWQLTRRFFLVDNLSSKTQKDQPASIIRYAKNIQLIFKMRNSDGQIYPPYMKINYESVESTASSVTVSFKTQYEMDVSKIEKNVKISVGVLSAFAIFYAIIRTSGWRKRSDKLYIDFSSFMHFVIFSCDAISFVLFCILAVTCIQWLIFFKQQTVVYRVLPLKAQENLLQALLICSFVFKTIDVIYLIFNQLFIDIFFIDWERPRGRIVAPGQMGSDEKNTPVSIMRTLFVANEWRELQTLKRLKPTLQLILVLFFLNVAGFEHLTTTDPVSRFKMNQSEDYVGEQSFVLRFSVTSILFLCIGIGQWIYFGMIYERFVSDAIEDFIDFCSISNVSIFILTHSNYGYYIHGRSVHGRADTNLKELYENFKREEDNLCDKRGLEPDSDCQTFEITIPSKFRRQYDLIFEAMRASSQPRQLARPALDQMSRSTQGAESKLPLQLERNVMAYSAMNKFLQSFIEHSSSDLEYTVKDKTLLERILDMELQPPVEKGLFYNDNNRSFATTFLYGVEWSLLIFDLLLFAIIDMASYNYTLAAVVTYLVDMIIIVIRDTFGKKNLSRKTLVHERFLI